MITGNNTSENNTSGNNDNWLSRTELLLGPERLSSLKDSRVLVVGLGGVGSYAAEMICRAGIGQMTIVDGDTVDSNNINRQLPALHSTLGRKKAEIVAERLKDINPELSLEVICSYIEDKQMESLVTQRFDYVIDAIDTLAPKVNLIYSCLKNNVPVVSSMGAGAKLDPSLIQVVDISKSYNCTLARKLRKRLYKLGIYRGFKVVFSPEAVIKESVILNPSKNKKTTAGTISYMPPVFGCFCASVVINHLLAKQALQMDAPPAALDGEDLLPGEIEFDELEENLEAEE